MNPSKGTQAVYFDFGDTLVVLEPQKEDLFMAAADAIGLKLEKPAVKRAYECVDTFVRYSSVTINNDSGRTEFYRMYNDRLCEALGISGRFDEMWPSVTQTFSKKNAKWRLRDGVMETLSSLRSRGVRLAIVANWDKQLSDLVKRLGVGGLIECVVASQQAGVEKPDPAIFRFALKEMSLLESPESVVYVGNEYRADIIGARAAGLVPCLLDIDNRYPCADCQRIAAINELLLFLD